MVFARRPANGFVPHRELVGLDPEVTEEMVGLELGKP